MARLVGFDCETNKEFDKKGSLRSIQLYFPEKEQAYVLHRPKGEVDFLKNVVDIKRAKELAATMGKEAAKAAITRTGEKVPVEKVKAFLASSRVSLVAHSGLFDCFIMLRDLEVMPNIEDDSFTFAMMIPTAPHVSRSLDNQMKRHVDESYDKAAWGSWADFDFDAPVLSDEAILYGAFDSMAAVTLIVQQKAKYPQYDNRVYRLEIELIRVLSEMRARGIHVRESEFDAALASFTKNVDDLNMELFRLRGKPVRVGSTADLSEWLFNERVLPGGGRNYPVIMTGKGKPSCSEDALALIADPVVDLIGEAKHSISVLGTLRKIKSENKGDREAGNMVFYPQFKPMSESSGSRIYTQDPSVNQWPWELRGCVRPQVDSASGGRFYYADVSAFELLVLAYAAGQEDLIETYLSGRDVHRKAAAAMFRKMEAEILDEQREATKVVEFATIYGSEGHSVARKLRIPITDAQVLMADFMEGLPAIKKLRESVHDRVLRTGTAVTHLGRVKRVSEAFGRTEGERASAKRKAFSFVAQSGAADIIKQALVGMHKDLAATSARLTFTVFDSILVDMGAESKGTIDQLVKKNLEVMVGARLWKFLFKSGVGATWGEAKESMEAPNWEC